WRLRNSHIHHCGQEGVHSGHDLSASFAIEGNEIDHIQTPPYVELCDKQCSFQMDRGAAVLVGMMGHSAGGVVRSNRIHDSCGGYQDGRCSGINVEGGGANLILESNLIWNLKIQAWPSGGRAFLFSVEAGCIDCVVRNNRVYNVDACFAFEDTLTYSMAIYNNTCANPWHTGIASEYGSELGSIAIVNNIFYSTTASQDALLKIDAGSEGVKIPTHNAFYCASGCVAAKFKGGMYTMNDIARLGPGNRWGDPNLSIAGTPPKLTIMSPAGSAYRGGIALVPGFSDCLNNERPSSGEWDIGAHLFTDAPAPAPRGPSGKQSPATGR